MAQSHGRDAGGTPARGDQVRRRVETAEEAEAEDSDSDSDEAMTAKRDVDTEWHLTKGLTVVPIGSTLVVVDGESSYPFKRTAAHEATCEACDKLFGVNAYHLRAFKAHGAACAAKQINRLATLRREAESVAWSGSISHAHTFDGDGGGDVTVFFEKISEVPGGFTRGVRCQCGDKLKAASERRAPRHVGRAPLHNGAAELADVSASLMHAAHHVLHAPITVPYLEMCPLCYGPASECPAFIEKTSSSYQPRIACTSFAPTADCDTLARCVKFTAAALAKSPKKSPSTNRPIVCPACHPNLAQEDHKLSGTGASRKRKDKKRPAVWSYNMKAHWRRLHNSTAMPAGLESALKLAPDEMKHLKSL